MRRSTGAALRGERAGEAPEDDAAGTSLGTFSFGSGVSKFAIGGVDLNQDGTVDLLLGVVPNTGQVQVLDPLTGALIDTLDAFSALTGGISLAGS